MFLVHLVDPHVTHKTWFYHNFFSSFLSRILKIKFWGSNILEPGSNILEPLNVPDWKCKIPCKTWDWDWHTKAGDREQDSLEIANLEKLEPVDHNDDDHDSHDNNDDNDDGDNKEFANFEKSGPDDW